MSNPTTQRVPPPPSPDDDVDRADHESESHHIVRERAFLPDRIDRVLTIIRHERASGRLVIDFNQGGIRTVRFHEETKITPRS